LEKRFPSQEEKEEEPSLPNWRKGEQLERGKADVLWKGGKKERQSAEPEVPSRRKISIYLGGEGGGVSRERRGEFASTERGKS